MRYKSTKYVLLDDQLYYKIVDGVLLKCLIQEILSNETLDNDWRVEIVDYLRNPSRKVTRKLRYKSTKYVLLDDQLYYKIVDGGVAQMLKS